jgi:histidinol-phosphatase (PHP family)
MLTMDYHLHSRFSGDGQPSIEEICRSALEKGIGRIAITDHHDIGNAKYEIADLEAYGAALRRARALFPELDVAFGLEMDYRPETWDQMRGIPKRIGLDFALLSLHFIDGVDPYLPEYFEGRTQRQGYELYMERLARMVASTEGPWVLGHLTYVSKFARFADPQMRYADYPDCLDEVLRLAAGKGYGLEVNASGIKNNAGLLPGADILRRFRELGGEIVTVGSDAHEAETVGRWVAEAQQAAGEAGFRHLAAFRGLAPQFIKID